MIALPISRIEQLAHSRKMLSENVLSKFSVDKNSVLISSIDDLKKLSDLLILPIETLLENADSDLHEGVKVCRKNGGFIRSANRNGLLYYTYQHLATSKSAPELMALRVTVHCNDSSALVLNDGHTSKELIYVTKGKIRMHWDRSGTRNEMDLDEGDSVYIAPAVPHSFICLGKNPAELLAFNY